MRLLLRQAALLIALVPHNGVNAQSGIRLTGAIQDQTAAGIAGATVILTSLDRVFQTESSANGSFAFNDLQPGLYEMQISAPGFVKQKRTLDLRMNSERQPLSIVLQVGSVPDMETCGAHAMLRYEPTGRQSASLTGVVRNFLNGKPVKKAKVILSPTSPHGAQLEAESDGAGRFVFQTVSVGRYDLRISLRGFWPVELKDLLIPRENGAYVDATLLRRNRMVACQ